MALFASASPVLPGRVDEWHRLVAEKILKGIHGLDLRAGTPGGLPKPGLLWEAGGSR